MSFTLMPTGATLSTVDDVPGGRNAAPSAVAARQLYLKSIGITRGDPFVMPVSEQELEFSQSAVSGEARQPSFFDLVAPPPLHNLPYMSIDESLKLLREPRTSVIFGVPGSGKTTLRLALDAYLRQKPDRTLSITYRYFPTRPTADFHWHALAKELAVDLFIQIVEQFESFRNPTPEQIEALRAQIVVGKLTHLVNRILDNPEPSSLWGLSDYWPSVYRATVRRVASSPAVLDLLRQSCQPLTELKTAHTGRAELLAGLQAARQWGFDRALVLVDGVDTPSRARRSMCALIRPLIAALPAWESQRVSFKFFLPLELQSPAAVMLKRIASGLTSPPLESIIGPWDDDSLRRLLAQRLRAGGSRRVGFDDVAGAGLAGQLDQLLIKSANGLPRRLLQLVSRLIDQHAARDAHDRLINLHDWTRMRLQWRDDPPAPLLPPET